MKTTDDYRNMHGVFFFFFGQLCASASSLVINVAHLSSNIIFPLFIFFLSSVLVIIFSPIGLDSETQKIIPVEVQGVNIEASNKSKAIRTKIKLKEKYNKTK